jgi:glycosyltransferase involved in cell wall biosynthesis
MRILAVCNLFPPYVMGGNEVRFQEILEGLQKEHEICLVSSLYESSKPEPDWIHRVLQQPIPYPKPLVNPKGYFRREIKAAGFNFRATKQIIEKFKPDVAYISDTKRVFLGAPYAARACGVPVVWDITDTSLAHYTGKKTLRRFLPRMSLGKLSFSHALTISKYIKDELCKAGVLSQNALPLNQGVHLESFVPGQLSVPPRRLIFVGSLIPDKGVHIILRALKELGEEYSLTICGDSGDANYKKSLSDYTKANGLESQVDFKGRVGGDQMPQIYREHDVFVFSSIWQEPFASTPLEAMACNLPVVGTLVGGQKDFFLHEENSMVYEKEDPADLAAQIRLLDDEALYRKVAQNGLKQVQAEHKFEDYVTKIEVVLEKAVQGRPL